MAKLNTLHKSTTHRVLIYGGPKSGKTQLAGALAKEYNLIWVDMENGKETLFKLPTELQKKIELINLPDTRSYPIAIETCLKMIKGKVSICDEHGKHMCMLCKRSGAPTVDLNLNDLGPEDIVVFDSLTQLTASAIANITKGQDDDYKLNYDDWGNLGKLMEIFLSHIQQAPYNVICISHETEAQLEDKKMKLVPVAGTRNFSRNVAKYFDHVIYAQVKNKKHVFASSSTYHNSILTGSRTDIEMEVDGKGDDEVGLMKIFTSTAPNAGTSKTASEVLKGISSVNRASTDVLNKLKGG